MEDIRRMEEETQKELEEVINSPNAQLSSQTYTELYCMFKADVKNAVKEFYPIVAFIFCVFLDVRGAHT